MDSAQKHFQLSVEIVENVRTIQLLTREQRFFEKYKEASHEMKWTEVKNGYLDGLFWSLTVGIRF